MSGFDQHLGRETRASISGVEVEGTAEQIANSRANR